MILMFIVMLVGAILCKIHSMDKLQIALETTMKNYTSNDLMTNSNDNLNKTNVTKAWDDVQIMVSFSACHFCLDKTLCVWYEVGVIWASKHTLKVMPQPWPSVFKQIWIRSFKRSTLCSCRSRGHKSIWGQSWISKKICLFYRAPGESVSNPAKSAIFFSISNFHLLHFYKLLTYKCVKYLIYVKDLIHISLNISKIR